MKIFIGLLLTVLVGCIESPKVNVPPPHIKVVTLTVDTTSNEKTEGYYTPTVSPSVGSTSTNSK